MEKQSRTVERPEQIPALPNLLKQWLQNDIFVVQATFHLQTPTLGFEICLESFLQGLDMSIPLLQPVGIIAWQA